MILLQNKGSSAALPTLHRTQVEPFTQPLRAKRGGGGRLKHETPYTARGKKKEEKKKEELARINSEAHVQSARWGVDRGMAGVRRLPVCIGVDHAKFKDDSSYGTLNW